MVNVAQSLDEAQPTTDCPQQTDNQVQKDHRSTISDSKSRIDQNRAKTMEKMRPQLNNSGPEIVYHNVNKLPLKRNGPNGEDDYRLRAKKRN